MQLPRMAQPATSYSIEEKCRTGRNCKSSDSRRLTELSPERPEFPALPFHPALARAPCSFVRTAKLGTYFPPHSRTEKNVVYIVIYIHFKHSLPAFLPPPLPPSVLSTANLSFLLAACAYHVPLHTYHLRHSQLGPSLRLQPQARLTLLPALPQQQRFSDKTQRVFYSMVCPPSAHTLG